MGEFASLMIVVMREKSGSGSPLSVHVFYRRIISSLMIVMMWGLVSSLDVFYRGSSRPGASLHCLVTLSLTIDETLKSLSSLPILMQESFWW